MQSFLICSHRQRGAYLLLPKVVSSPHRHVSTKLQKTIKSSNSCRIARLLYHSINGGSISVFTSSNSNQRNWVLALMAMDAANKLSAIAAEMGKLQNEIQEHRRVLNFLLRSVRTMDPARKEARIRATRERIEGLEDCGRSSKRSLFMEHSVAWETRRN